MAKKLMGIAVAVVVMAFVAVTLIGGSDHDVQVADFDTQSELQNELTLSGVEVTSDGFVQLKDANTSGTATTPVYDEDGNISRIVTHFSNNAGDLNVTATGYDEGGTQVSSQTYDDPSDIDLTAQDGTEFDFEYSFSRDTTSDTSPQLDAYSVYDLGQPTSFLIALIAMVGIGVAVVASRGF